MRKILIVPDCHWPYVDKRAFKLMIKAAREVVEPDIIVVLGDFVDCEAVSVHGKNLERRLNIRHEIESAEEGLDMLDGLGAKEKYFVMGNHEARLPKYIADKCPELFGIIPPVEDLLGLGDRGWKVTQYKDYAKIGKVYYTHDDDNAGAQAHDKARQTYEGCVVIGHTHRASISYTGNMVGEAKVGMMCGWLGDSGKVDYMHRAKLRYWQLGFGTGLLEKDGTTFLQVHPIVNYRVAVDGQIIK